MKYVMFLVSLLFWKRNGGETPSKMVDLIKRTIREEIFAIGFRLLFGAILVSAIIFSIWQVVLSGSIAMDQLENALAIKILVFAMTALTGSVALYLLFHFTGTLPKPQESNPRAELSLKVEMMALKFAEGLLDGIQRRRSTNGSHAHEKNADF
jgi:hypothetical protein